MSSTNNLFDQLLTATTKAKTTMSALINSDQPLSHANAALARAKGNLPTLPVTSSSSSSRLQLLHLSSVQQKVLAGTGIVVAAGAAYALYWLLTRPRWKDLPPLFPPKMKIQEKLIRHVYAHAREGDVQSVINEIDSFCWREEWMMNVGDEKGKILDAELQKKQPRVTVELGGYCGYSALRIGAIVSKFGGHLYSIEIDPFNAAIATKILEFAGLKDVVTVVVGTVEPRLQYLQKQLAIERIDLLFLDHAKEVYKSDLIRLENAGLIQPGSVLVADNCLIPGCPDFGEYSVLAASSSNILLLRMCADSVLCSSAISVTVEYVTNHPQYDTVKHVTHLEYCNDPDWVLVSTRK